MTIRVGILGAGSIGRFLAVRLTASGVPTVLVGRRPIDPAALAAVTVEGRRLEAGDDLVAGTDPALLATVDVCLVAVKSSDTADAANALAGVLPAEVPVVSLQNGLDNGERLASELGPRAVGGIVTYNVYREGEVVHQASSGVLMAGLPPGSGAHRLRQLKAAFREAGETLELRRDIGRVLAGKLLLNLNNGVCAATGLTIRESLRSRDTRWCFAQCLREGVQVMRHAGMDPARVTILPPRAIATMLSLPDAVVLRVARKVADIDPHARSSTLQDLDRGRPTEIDELNGAVVRIAEKAGIEAPANAVITAVVHEHEQAVTTGRPLTFPSPAELRERIRAAGSE